MQDVEERPSVLRSSAGTVIFDYYSGDGGIDADDFASRCQGIANDVGVMLVGVTSRYNDRHDPPRGCNILRVELDGTDEACRAFEVAVGIVTFG